MGLPEELGKLVPKETIGKVYEDAFSPLAKEIGKLGGDVGKVGRLILFPLQIAASWQDQLERSIKRIADAVPVERQTEVRPEIAAPTIEAMRYLDEDSELWKMFEQILLKSVDSETAGSVHPSFPHMVKLISRDEAWILFRLKAANFEVVDTLDLNEETRTWENRRIEQSQLPTSDLILPDQMELFYAHLESMGLVIWPVHNQDPIVDAAGRQTGLRRRSKMMLTELGKLFVEACIPPAGFKRDVGP